jgi:hypothetical protein
MSVAHRRNGGHIEAPRRRDLVVLLAFLACMDSSDSDVQNGCEIEASARHLAGAGARDCGSVGIDEDPTAVDACVISSFEKHAPFYAIYTLQGIDSQVMMAFVGNGTSVWTLSYDSDPSGGSDVGAVIYQSTCLEPTVQKGKTGQAELTCSASTSQKICDEGID